MDVWGSFIHNCQSLETTTHIYYETSLSGLNAYMKFSGTFYENGNNSFENSIDVPAPCLPLKQNKTNKEKLTSLHTIYI